MLRVPPSSQWLCQLANPRIYCAIWLKRDRTEGSEVLAGEQLQQLAADDADRCRSICTDPRNLWQAWRLLRFRAIEPRFFRTVVG